MKKVIALALLFFVAASFISCDDIDLPEESARSGEVYVDGNDNVIDDIFDINPDFEVGE